MIKIDDICRLFDDKICICSRCQAELEPVFISFKVNGYKALSVYEYTPYIKNLIYLYKGCFDYEMKEVFLNLFYREIKARFSNYKIIPIPSYHEDDNKRGFNHVVEAYKILGLDCLNIIEKTAHHKQAEKSANKRKMISKYLALTSRPNLEKTKVLIVDDIYTTGATMKAAINLVESLNPKEIRVLVLAKTSDKAFKKVNKNNFYY